MSKKKTAPVKGEAAFDLYFRGVYGDRWENLKAALLQEDLKVARANSFYDDKPTIIDIVEGDEDLGIRDVFVDPDLKNCFRLLPSFDLGNFTTPSLPFYRMDPASILAARALDVQSGDSVLDMCAAPGGKTLVLVEAMGTSGRMVANELSAKRRFRMMAVVKRYLPTETRRQITIKGIDGARFGLGKTQFDRILLDAPCSGERGVLQKQSDLQLWTEKRSKRFAIKQYALLSSAFLCLKPGGRIVYSTCSISPHENDGVVEKLHRRHDGKFKVLHANYNRGEKTKYGCQFLPDGDGWGPIYFSIIEKNQ